MSSEFEFEEFDRKSSPSNTTPLITIQARGTCSANRAAFEALGSPEGIKLLYDKKRRVIGIRPADPKERNAYAMRKQPASDSYLFSGTAFANHNGIPIGETRRYQAHVHGEILTVDLKELPLVGPPVDLDQRDQPGRQATP